MLSNKLRRTIQIAVLILAIVLFIGLGLVSGYRYILNQEKRLKSFDQQMKWASEREKALKETVLAQTNEAGEQIGPKDAEGMLIPASPTLTPLPSIPQAEQVALNSESPGAVMIFVKVGDTPQAIAKQLKEKGIISDTTVFNLFVRVNGYSSAFRQGTHFVRKGMSYDQLTYILSQDPASKTVRIQDGSSYLEIKETLKKNGIYVNDEELDRMVKQPNDFMDYDFVRAIPGVNNEGAKKDKKEAEAQAKEESKRDNALEGYLFPDTYKFDMNADSETILRTFLNNFENRVDEKMMQRAKELGYSMDQILTLASIIQKESGNEADMYRISRVFHNRLEKGVRLQSDVTVHYAQRKLGLKINVNPSQADLDLQDPYNTYVNDGLPPGPIGSPSRAAILAALYPDTKDMNTMYFLATLDGSGTTVFADTYEEHQANIAKYLQ